jgi:hypothetical protein
MISVSDIIDQRKRLVKIAMVGDELARINSTMEHRSPNQSCGTVHPRKNETPLAGKTKVQIQLNQDGLVRLVFDFNLAPNASDL